MIGERLKLIRTEKNLTQKSFSELLSTSSGFISEIEQGKKMPGIDLLMSLKRVFNLSIDWLLEGKGVPYPSQGGERNVDSTGLERKALNYDLMKRIIIAVEKELDTRDLVLSPEKKAEALLLLYELFSGTEKQVNGGTVARYLKLVA